MKSRNTQIFLLYLCSFGFLITSCIKTTEPESYPTPTRKPLPIWLSNFTKNPACPPPCWEGITPGVTTGEQAKLLLEQSPDVKNLYQDSMIPFGPALLWLNGSAMLGDDNTVQMIWLRISFSGVRLEQVVNHYGNPKYVAFSNWHSNIVTVDLLYPDVGLVISLYQDDLGQGPTNIKVDISPQDEVADILYFAPGLEYYYSKKVWIPLQQYEWKGFQTYP